MSLRLEVLQFHDDSNRTLVQRIPPQGTTDIKYGAQLIVQDGQEAIFVRDGKALDAFGPGRHTLTTANVPLITRLLTIPWEKSPFQAAVYFVGMQTFLDQKWGTRQPITLRDKDFGLVRLRAFGKFSYRVIDSALLLGTLVGTQGTYTTEEASSHLRDVIVSKLTDLLGSLGVGLIDLPARFDEVATAARVKAADQFSKYGLELVDFFLSAISPPEEVQRAIDARSSMGALGDLKSFTMYKAADSLSKMAGHGGSGSGAMEMGMGAGMGMMMPQWIREAMNAPQASTPPAAPAPPQAPAAPAANSSRGSSVSFSDLAPSVPTAAPSDVRAMLRQVVHSAGWQVEEAGDRWRIVVPIGALRKQTVTADFAALDEEGHALVAYSSSCGVADERNAMALLRYNSRLAHGAFAVESTPGGEMIVLRASHLAETADPLEALRLITAIAWQADRAEEQLTGKDVL